MDGTVLRLDISSEEIDGARKALRQLFLEHGVDAVFRPVLGTIRGSLAKLEKRGTSTGRIRRRAYEILDAVETAGADRATACADAAAVLAELHRAGYRMALVSNNGRGGIELALRVVGLPESVFSAIVSRDDVDLEKPHGEPILRALEQLGLQRKGASVVMVGDTLGDMRSARAAAETAQLPLSVFTVAVGEWVCQQFDDGAGLVDRYVTRLGELPSVIRAVGATDSGEGPSGTSDGDLTSHI